MLSAGVCQSGIWFCCLIDLLGGPDIFRDADLIKRAYEILL